MQRLFVLAAMAALFLVGCGETADKAKDAAGKAADKGAEMVKDGADAAADAVKDATGSDNK